MGWWAGCNGVSRTHVGVLPLRLPTYWSPGGVSAIMEEEQAHPSVPFMPQWSLCADIPFSMTVWIHGKYSDYFPKDKQAEVTLIVHMPAGY